MSILANLSVCVPLRKEAKYWQGQSGGGAKVNLHIFNKEDRMLFKTFSLKTLIYKPKKT